MVSPSQKRHAAQSVVAAGECSGRQACRYLGLARSTMAYTPAPPTTRERLICEEVVAISRRLPRIGYRKVHAMLDRKGLRCDLRTVQRIRRREGLRIIGPARRPKLPPRPDAKVKSVAVNDVWCVDILFDVTAGGVTVKFLTIVDEFSHFCLDIVASRRLGAVDVIAALMVLVEIHGAPLHLRCDNGGEFIADDLKKWLAHAGIQTRFIEPGSPWQNGVNESFNGKFRDECLNRELLVNVLEAQCVALVYRDEYNNIRPHMTIGYRTPAEYRAELLGQAPGSGRTCQARSSLRLELASVPVSDHNLNPHHQPALTLTAGGSTS